MLTHKPRKAEPLSDYAECFYAFYGERLRAVERPTACRKSVWYLGILGILGAVGLSIFHFASCGSEPTYSAANGPCSCDNLTTTNLTTSALKFDEFDNGSLNLKGNLFKSAAPAAGPSMQLWWNTASSDGSMFSTGITDQNGNYSELVQLNAASHNAGDNPHGPIGQGELRLFDRATDKGWLALGYYEYGASIITPNLFEVMSHGFSIRDYNATGTPVLYVRDRADVTDIRFYHDGNYGHIGDEGPNTTVTIDSWLRLFDPTGNPWYVWPDSNGVLHATQTPPGPWPVASVALK